MKKNIIGVVTLGLVLFSCSKKAVAPATEVKVTDEAKMEMPAEIAEGKSLYENNCGKCHMLFPASKHDKAGWVKTVDRMAPKAKITDAQKTLVYNYLTYGM